jgi:hypothetical protein
MLTEPQDGRSAIRAIFDANENVFKLLFPGAAHINNSGIQNNLRPLLERRLIEDDIARRAELKLMSAFQSWVEAAHFYRHEAGQSVPAQPPENLVVQMDVSKYLAKSAR